jgi:hypothetical protein
MKAKLMFDLTDPDESMDFKKAVMANEMANVIWSIKNWVLRKAYKEDLTAEQIIDLLNTELNELPFDLEELVK